MANQIYECPSCETVAAERVRYFPRQLLTDNDMLMDQEYFRLKLRRHNRFMHGWGTVCGLLVTAAPDVDAAGSSSPKTPWRVQISSGYALGPYGDEIFVGPDEQIFLDLATCASAISDPCQPGYLLGPGGTPLGGSTIYVAIRYAECMTRPVRVTPCGCGCEPLACENSRIRDSFQAQCLTLLPVSYQVSPPAITLCDYVNGQAIPDCPPCPSDPWVILAAVTLPDSPSTPLSNDNIDNFKLRRQILSTALLQQQIIACCCMQADLQVEQQLEPIKNHGQGQALAIAVRNNGPSVAENVTVVADVQVVGQAGQANFNQIVTVSPQAPLSQTPTGLQANLGTLNSNQIFPVLRCRIDPKAGATPGRYTLLSVAIVTSTTPDPNMDNNINVVAGQIIVSS